MCWWPQPPSAAWLAAGRPGPAAGGPGMSGQPPCRGGAPGGRESEAPPGPGVTLLSHILKNFPQCVVIHIVKVFRVVGLELSDQREKLWEVETELRKSRCK